MSTIPEQFERPLAIIERNARLQARLIEDLLDVSSIASGKLQLNSQEIDACQLIKNAVQAIAPSAAAKAIRVHTDLPTAPIHLSADPVRLAQVFDNLLSNAVKFTPQNGEVRVVGRPLDALLEIRISDSGHGITSDFLPHVFDRFRQADASTSRRHGGLGLGLSIVRQLVQLHGGTVRAESPGAGQGATFTVCLPRSPQSLAAPAGEEAFLLRRESLRDLRILVVDDDDDTRELIARILEQSHARVDTVADAAAALEYLRLRKPDILVSDIGMPGMDGLALIREVRANHDIATLPAIAVTAFVRPDDRERTLKSGFQMHIAKPVDPLELNLAVAVLTGRHASA
jgi:CheY-like chemotaxis protein